VQKKATRKKGKGKEMKLKVFLYTKEVILKKAWIRTPSQIIGKVRDNNCSLENF